MPREEPGQRWMLRAVKEQNKDQGTEKPPYRRQWRTFLHALLHGRYREGTVHKLPERNQPTDPNFVEPIVEENNLYDM